MIFSINTVKKEKVNSHLRKIEKTEVANIKWSLRVFIDMPNQSTFNIFISYEDFPSSSDFLVQMKWALGLNLPKQFLQNGRKYIEQSVRFEYDGVAINWYSTKNKMTLEDKSLKMRFSSRKYPSSKGLGREVFATTQDHPMFDTLFFNYPSDNLKFQYEVDDSNLYLIIKKQINPERTK